jgi:hypothetical protein
MRSLRPTFLLVLASLLAAGCPGPEAPTDTNGALDAPASDGGPVDAPAIDGGDAGLDGGGMDAPVLEDGGSMDGGGLGEGGIGDGAVGEGGIGDGSIGEGGTGEGGVGDGSVGEGGIGDGSIGEGGVGDGGVGDAGPTTTCAISASPSMGDVDDDFTITAASNGTTCTAVLDGGLMLTIPCNATMTLPGSTFGVGDHTLELDVGSGPGGPTTCSTSFTVTDVVTPSTTCTMDITPASGSPSTTFTATFASNGSDCSLSVGGIPLGTTACTSSFSGMGSLLGPGTYDGTLTVGAGPGGPTSCSDTFTVTP